MSKIETKKEIRNYLHFMVLPLKFVGCWDWFDQPSSEYKIFINNAYLGFVLFVLTNLFLSLIVLLHADWVDVMSSLDKIADGLPLVVSVAIVSYFALYRNEFYELAAFMGKYFKYHSARGLTNMTMLQSYKAAKIFGYFYTSCATFSVTMYVILPIIAHIWTGAPLQPWIYTDVTSTPVVVFLFLRQCIAQAFVALSIGQLSVFFAANSILLCGQLELLSCSLRNVRYTALLQSGVAHSSLIRRHYDIRDDERHNYIYNKSEVRDYGYHYDKEVINNFMDTRTTFDIYSPEFDEETSAALRECARVYQLCNEFKELFENFVSPLLVLRVVQVTLYLCILLYAATLKFDMVTVEYLGAVALDIYVYCYFGNQIILQANRLSTATYQSAWHTMGVRSRRLILNMLLANRKLVVVRAGRFLPMDLNTFVVIIKTSFSYYTLLVNMNN